MQLVAVWGPVVYLGSMSCFVLPIWGSTVLFHSLRPNLTMFFEVMVMVYNLAV